MVAVGHTAVGVIVEVRGIRIDVIYLKYPGADHNLQPNGWADAVSRSLDFYQNYLFAK